MIRMRVGSGLNLLQSNILSKVSCTYWYELYIVLDMTRQEKSVASISSSCQTKERLNLFKENKLSMLQSNHSGLCFLITTILFTV